MQSGTEEKLRQRLSLYRSLFSLIKAPRAEDEVIHQVVDILYDHFRDYRASFIWMTPEGLGTVVYSRQEEGRPSLTGKQFDISSTPGLLQMMRDGKPSVVPDVRAVPALAVHANFLLAIGANLSRLDIPFRHPDGYVSILALTSDKPVNWESETVELMVEIGELVGLMLREARAQDKLHRSELTFREFAENVQVVFWMTDVKKKEMVYVSPAYETIWGRSLESLYRDPNSFLDAVHPDDRDRVGAAVSRQAEVPYEEIYRVVWPDGEVRWVKDRGFRVRDERGQVHRIAGIAEDITPLRKAQEKLEATQAQVISNAKFAALGEMASGIAHEINNPLAVIHGLAVQLQELVRKQGSPNAMVIESLGTMETMSNRIAAIVKGLRTFSRQTDGDPRLPADLCAIAQETMAMCEARLRDAGIQVTVTVPMSRVMVRCRSSEISQVLLNLVNNAYDAVLAVKARSITVEVEGLGGTARISVVDSGPGIDPPLRDRIFQPFFTTKEVGRGTGLGLSISKGIVEAHGGTLFVDEGSRQTRFVVELPSETT